MYTLVEKIEEEAGKLGTFWPSEWLSSDFPHARLFTLRYKTNLTQWSGASLPLQEVSSMLMEKLVAAGIGNRLIVFVIHRLGGLVVKQILHTAKEEKHENERANFNSFYNMKSDDNNNLKAAPTPTPNAASKPKQ